MVNLYSLIVRVFFQKFYTFFVFIKKGKIKNIFSTKSKKKWKVDVQKRAEGVWQKSGVERSTVKLSCWQERPRSFASKLDRQMREDK